MAFLRLVIFGFIGLTVAYLLLSMHFRNARREALERKFPGQHDRIAKGMAEYQHGLRRKLLWLVYVIPVVAIGAIVYVVNVD